MDTGAELLVIIYSPAYQETDGVGALDAEHGGPARREQRVELAPGRVGAVEEPNGHHDGRVEQARRPQHARESKRLEV